MKNKNRFKLFGLTILFTAIVFNFTVCSDSNGGGGGGGGVASPPDSPTSTTYTSKDDNNTYVLKITDSSARAVYTPKNGDNYELTINPGNKKSTGKVTVTNNGFNLTPTGSTTQFTVKIEKTETGVLLMTDITGTIVTNNGNVTPGAIRLVVEFDEFTLYANPYGGEKWNYLFRYSDFSIIPIQKDDVIILEISGTPSKAIENFNIALECSNSNWDEYQLIGSTYGQGTVFSETFNNKEFKITVQDKPRSDLNLHVGLYNNVPIPAGTEPFSPMVTIKNFKISLRKE